ncbi:hypothetical protein N2152v2_008176 [Parachlorella kessleri]
MTEQANCKLTGADFLVQRYQAAKAVPDAQRTHDVAAFVRSYELVDEVVKALPWIQATPPAPPPLPNDVLCASLFKYFQAQRIRVHELAYPFIWMPHLMGQLYPLWCFHLPAKGFSGTSKIPSYPGPALKSACDPAVPLAEAGSPLLPGLLCLLLLAELVGFNPSVQQEAQAVLEKVAAALRDPVQGAQLRQELAALWQGPTVPASKGSTPSSDGRHGGDLTCGSGSRSTPAAADSSSGTGSGTCQGPIMSLEELEWYTLGQLVALATYRIEGLGPCSAAYALLDKAKAAANRMISLAADDPDSHYAHMTLCNIEGQPAEGLASLERCLALSEQRGSQFDIANYATSVGFSAVKVFEERYEEGPGQSTKAYAAARRHLAQRLAALVVKAKTASKAVQGLLPEPALGYLRTNRRRLKALAQRFAASKQAMAGILTPEQQDLARVPTSAEGEAARELRCGSCGHLALSAKVCGGCRRVHYCSVINTAANTAPANCEQDVEGARALNIPTKLLDALDRHARVSGTQPVLVHISTDHVYDGGSSWYKEDTQCKPVNAYGLSKVDGEEAVRQRWRRHVILRSSIIFGPPPPAPVKRGLFLQFIDSSLADKKPTTFFTDEWRTPTHVKDLVQACKAACEHVDTLPPDQRTFNIAGPERINRMDMALAVAELRGYDPALILPGSATGPAVKRACATPADISMDCSRAEALLGVRGTPFKQALREIFGDAAA